MTSFQDNANEVGLHVVEDVQFDLDIQIINKFNEMIIGIYVSLKKQNTDYDSWKQSYYQKIKNEGSLNLFFEIWKILSMEEKEEEERKMKPSLNIQERIFFNPG